MRRMLAFVVLAVSIVAPAAGRAAVTATPSVAQSWFFNWGEPDPNGGFRQIDLFVTNTGGATYNGSTATPTAEFKASGSDYSCDANWDCGSTNFNSQQVAPTAFQVDPAGNSIRFTACLNPSSGGSCRNFDLTAVRPGQLYQCVACSVPNAWFDPTSNQAGATVYAYSGFSRSQYTITGTFNSTPLTVVAGGPAQDTYNEYLLGTIVATVP